MTKINQEAAQVTTVDADVANSYVKIDDTESTVLGLTTKSAQIRYLAAQGWKTGRIASYLSKVHYPNGEKNVRYQHVRNVLNQKLSGE